MAGIYPNRFLFTLVCLALFWPMWELIPEVEEPEVEEEDPMSFYEYFTSLLTLVLAIGFLMGVVHHREKLQSRVVKATNLAVENYNRKFFTGLIYFVNSTNFACELYMTDETKLDRSTVWKTYAITYFLSTMITVYLWRRAEILQYFERRETSLKYPNKKYGNSPDLSTFLLINTMLTTAIYGQYNEESMKSFTDDVWSKAPTPESANSFISKVSLAIYLILWHFRDIPDMIRWTRTTVVETLDFVVDQMRVVWTMLGLDITGEYETYPKFITFSIVVVGFLAMMASMVLDDEDYSRFQNEFKKGMDSVKDMIDEEGVKAKIPPNIRRNSPLLVACIVTPVIVLGGIVYYIFRSKRQNNIAINRSTIPWNLLAVTAVILVCLGTVAYRHFGRVIIVDEELEHSAAETFEPVRMVKPLIQRTNVGVRIITELCMKTVGPEANVIQCKRNLQENCKFNIDDFLLEKNNFDPKASKIQSLSQCLKEKYALPKRFLLDTYETLTQEQAMPTYKIERPRGSSSPRRDDGTVVTLFAILAFTTLVCLAVLTYVSRLYFKRKNNVVLKKSERKASVQQLKEYDTLELELVLFEFPDDLTEVPTDRADVDMEPPSRDYTAVRNDEVLWDYMFRFMIGIR